MKVYFVAHCKNVSCCLPTCPDLIINYYVYSVPGISNSQFSV